VFGFKRRDGSNRNFVVEIDRGTIPVVRASIEQISFERKIRTYLAAYAAKQHERQFGWKTFRVLTVTTDEHRLQSTIDALRSLLVAHSPGASMFLFTTRAALRAGDPMSYTWLDGVGRVAHLD